MKRLKIFCDGASRGNPGPSGIGYLIVDCSGKVLKEGKKFIGMSTNNQAEYYAVMESIKDAMALGAEEIELYTDSELVVRQLSGEYAVRDPKLVPLHEELLSLISRLSRFEVKHISREENAAADALANMAIDGCMGREREGGPQSCRSKPTDG